MRILQVHTRYREAGGEDAVVDAEAALLEAAGHDVVRHHAANPAGTADSVRLLAQAPRNLAAASGVRDAVRRHRPDVVHVHNTWFALSPAVVSAAANEGTPVVATLHNYRLVCANAELFRDGAACQDCVGSHPWHAVAHRCYRGSAVQSLFAAATVAGNRRTWQSSVARFLVLNEFARQRFVEAGFPPHRLRVKPNFVADPGARDAPPSRSDVVLFVGRLVREKGLEVLLDAWERAAPAGLELVVIGDGPLQTALAQRDVPRVRLLGQQPADVVRGAMRSARLLVFPSLLYEGQPMTVLEAFAAGLPVLANDQGGNSELVGGLGAAWLVPGGTVDAWAAALAALPGGDVADEAGAAARQRYEADFTPERAIQRLEAAYREAIGEQRVRR